MPLPYANSAKKYPTTERAIVAMASGTGYPIPGTADCDSFCAARIEAVFCRAPAIAPMQCRIQMEYVTPGPPGHELGQQADDLARRSVYRTLGQYIYGWWWF
jgi:hypothetical protein